MSTLHQGVDVLLPLITVAALSLAGAKKKAQNEIKEMSHLSKAERLGAEARIHIDIHKGIDVRATVFIVAYVTLVGSVLGALKDNKGIVPLWLMLCFSLVTVVGTAFSGISLWASRRNLAKPRTPEQVLEDAGRIVSPRTQLELAAVQLSACEHITSRKRKWANRSLIMLALDTAIVVFSVSFNLQA